MFEFIANDKQAIVVALGSAVDFSWLSGFLLYRLATN